MARIEEFIQLISLENHITPQGNLEIGALDQRPLDWKLMIGSGSGGAKPEDYTDMSGRNTSCIGNDPANAQRAENQ
ncbi:hypothetical protein Tco_0956805 [Tanacetum coccineum]